MTIYWTQALKNIFKKKIILPLLPQIMKNGVLNTPLC